MALNFLKRNRISRKNVPLYHNPSIKNQSRCEFASSAGKISKSETEDFTSQLVPQIHRNKTPQEQVTFDELIEIKLKSNPLEIESFEEDNVAGQNWDRAKERIEKLLYEIYDLLSSDDNIKRKFNSMIDSFGNKVNNQEPQNQPEQSVPKQSCPEQNKSKINKGSRFPLDIKELHSVAAMARRLSTRSKIKNNPV